MGFLSTTILNYKTIFRVKWGKWLSSYCFRVTKNIFAGPPKEGSELLWKKNAYSHLYSTPKCKKSNYFKLLCFFEILEFCFYPQVDIWSPALYQGSVECSEVAESDPPGQGRWGGGCQEETGNNLEKQSSSQQIWYWME